MGLWNTYFGKILMTFLMSMVPVVELRGAIPYGVASGLSLPLSVILAILGNLLPVPFIILFIRKLFAWLRKISPWLDGLVSRLERRAEKKADIIVRYEFWGLALLVAIPLPGTGAWTGALVAAMMDLRLRNALPAIAIGVVIAAVLVSLVTHGVGALIA